MLHSPEARWLSLFVLLLSGAGLLYCAAVLAATRRKPDKQVPPATPDRQGRAASRQGFLYSAAAFMVLGSLLYAATLRQSPPFSPGQRLGAGFAIGALVALVAAALIRLVAWSEHTDRVDPSSSPPSWTRPLAAVLGLQSLATATVWFSLHTYAGDPLYVLLGIAAGACFIGFVRAVPAEIEGLARESVGISPGGNQWKGDATVLISLCLTIVGLSWATAMAVHHEPSVSVPWRVWWIMPAAIGSLSIFHSLTEATLWAWDGRRLPFAFSILTVAGPAYFVLHHTIGDISWIKPALIGLVTGVVAHSLLSSFPENREPADLRLGALLVLILMGGGVLAFRLKQGFGVALLGVGLIPAINRLMADSLQRAAGDEHADSTHSDEPSRMPLSALGLGLSAILGIVAFRLFYQRYDLPGSRADLFTHYTLIGLICGAVAPLGVASLLHAAHGWACRRMCTGDWSRRDESRLILMTILAALGAGLASGAIPALLVCLWGLSSAAGMVAGATVSAMLLLMLWPTGCLPRGIGVAGLCAIHVGLCLGALHLAQLVEPLIQIPRAQKMWIAGGALGLAVVVVTAGMIMRLRPRLKLRPVPAITPTS